MKKILFFLFLVTALSSCTTTGNLKINWGEEILSNHRPGNFWIQYEEVLVPENGKFVYKEAPVLYTLVKEDFDGDPLYREQALMNLSSFLLKETQKSSLTISGMRTETFDVSGIGYAVAYIPINKRLTKMLSSL